MNELAVIVPNPKIIELSGEKIEIKPFTFGQLPKVMELIAKLTEPASQIKSFQTQELAKIFSVFGEDIIQVLSVCLNKPVDFINNLRQDEGILLVKTFIEVNADFFTQTVLPLVKDMVEQKLKDGVK
jgi:hypothetical protein